VASQPDDAAHQDEEHEEHESDQVEDHPERGDDTAEPKALEEEQDSDEDRESHPRQRGTPRSGWSEWDYRSVGDEIQRASDRSCRPRTGWPPARYGQRGQRSRFVRDGCGSERRR